MATALVTFRGRANGVAFTAGGPWSTSATGRCGSAKARSQASRQPAASYASDARSVASSWPYARSAAVSAMARRRSPGCLNAAVPHTVRRFPPHPRQHGLTARSGYTAHRLRTHTVRSHESSRRERFAPRTLSTRTAHTKRCKPNQSTATTMHTKPCGHQLTTPPHQVQLFCRSDPVSA